MSTERLAPAAPWHAWLRLALAAAATALLTLGWGRTVILAMVQGVPETFTLLATFAVFLVAFLLTVRLRGAFGLPTSWTRFDRILAVALPLLWCGAYVGLFGWYIGSMEPIWKMYLVFVPSTFWLLFAAWFAWWPARPKLKTALLLLLLLLAVDFPLLVKADLAGEGSVNLAWREVGAPPAPKPPTGRGAGGRAELPAAAGPADFPRFLGAAGDAMLSGAKVAGAWTATPPKLLWKVRVGEGWSSFAIVGGYCFTQEQDGPEECVVCRKIRTGEEVWRRRAAARLEGSMGGTGPRATPTVAEGRVYALGATGMLCCLDAADGKPLWSVDTLKDNGAADNLAHGVCGSPLVHAGKVIVSPPGKGGPALVAYAAADGKRLWQACPRQASYSSPQLAMLCGAPQILVYCGDGVSAHAPADGKELWFFPWTNNVQVNASQPLAVAAAEGRLLVSTGYGQGSALIEAAKGEGGWRVKTLWDNRRLLQAKFTTAVIFDGHVYGLDNGILCCLDPKDGKQLWKGGRYGHGQLLLAGDRLIVQAEDGAVALVEPNPKELRERGRIKALAGKTWNHPALAGRLLLVRNDTEAACYELPPP